nr:MAG TPA: hypothetical protein [Caudoviricetes sp.]
MEDKKQDVNVLEELSKAADDFRKWAVDFGDKLSKVLDDIKALKKEEDTWEMKIPYKYGDDYWVILDNGDIDSECWDEYETDGKRFNTGNVFPTLKTADLEKKRRNLLTRFRSFRDECNGDWKPDWNDIDQKKYIIRCEETDLYYVVAYCTLNGFNLFGYFKNEQDAERAIDLFGDEIKELFM